MQDHELIRRILQGDRALFGQLADKYYDEIFRYCRYQTGNEHDACDCTQETFYRLLRFLDSYTERGQFKAYLLRIALNVCRDYYRKKDLQHLSYEDMAESGSCEAFNVETGIPSASGRQKRNAASQPSPERQVETRLLIQTALNELPEFQREVIVLYYYHGCKQREIARITGVPLSTVKTRLRAGTGKLQELLSRMGMTSASEC